jgi:hypothetical protein
MMFSNYDIWKTTPPDWHATDEERGEWLSAECALADGLEELEDRCGDDLPEASG